MDLRKIDLWAKSQYKTYMKFKSQINWIPSPSYAVIHISSLYPVYGDDALTDEHLFQTFWIDEYILCSSVDLSKISQIFIKMKESKYNIQTNLES